MSRVPPSWRFLCGGSPRIKRRRIRKRQDGETSDVCGGSFPRKARAPVPALFAALTTEIEVLLCRVDDPHKNSYFIDGLLLAIDIVAIA